MARYKYETPKVEDPVIEVRADDGSGPSCDECGCNCRYPMRRIDGRWTCSSCRSKK